MSEVSDYTIEFEAIGLPDDVDIFTVSTSPDANQKDYPPSEWLGGDWQIPVLADSEAREVATAFGVSAFPFTVFVYADGTIAARATGALDFDDFMGAVDFLANNPTG